MILTHFSQSQSSQLDPLEEVSAATPDAHAEYTIGVDLGQSFDPTAIAIIRKLGGNTDAPIFQVGHLERLPLQTPYPGVVAHVGRLLQRLRGQSELVIDYTGVGRPVFDMFQVAGLSPIGVSIVAGDTISNEGLVYRVPKLVLISRVQALLHAGRLKIHKHLPDAGTLVEELQSFKAEITDFGNFRFGARSGKHDDLVLAVAIALWRAHGDTCFSGWNVFEYYRQQYGGGGTDRELTALPKPLPPIEPPEGPQHGFSFGNQTVPRVDVVVLQPPAAISQASGMSGRTYRPDPASGLFTVTVEDSKPLINNAGWKKVEPTIARWRPPS
jgi:hypothetical protein